MSEQVNAGMSEQIDAGTGDGRRIGVFICHCGGNISDYVDVAKVRDALADEPDELVHDPRVGPAVRARHRLDEIHDRDTTRHRRPSKRHGEQHYEE